MRHRLPAPRPIDWEMRALETAVTRDDVLPDGRRQLTIEHAPLEGVTPRMLGWWFRTAWQDMDWNGATCPRYQIWHPVDHIRLSVVRRDRAGNVGTGARLHIVEAFGGNLAYLVDQVVDVARLDEGGITLEVRVLGRVAMELAHTFTADRGGTRYFTRMRLGFDSGPLRPLGTLLRRRRFSEAKSRAWLVHNVEEVGNLPHFLPELYDRCKGRLDP